MCIWQRALRRCLFCNIPRFRPPMNLKFLVSLSSTLKFSPLVHYIQDNKAQSLNCNDQRAMNAKHNWKNLACIMELLLSLLNLIWHGTLKIWPGPFFKLPYFVATKKHTMLKTRIVSNVKILHSNWKLSTFGTTSAFGSWDFFLKSYLNFHFFGHLQFSPWLWGRPIFQIWHEKGTKWKFRHLARPQWHQWHQSK